MTHSAVEEALAHIPEDATSDFTNPAAAFQAAFQTRIMRENLKVGQRGRNRVESHVESAWFQRLNLRCDELVSQFVFDCR
jgi:hypothetical protein